MKENSLAKRYASGLIKTLENEKEYSLVKSELEEFATLLDSLDDLKAGMQTMLFSKNQKLEVLDSIREKTKFSDKTTAFLKEAIEENRLMYLEIMIAALENLWFEKSGIEKLKVFSAVQLTKTLEKKLIANLEKAFNKKIIIDAEVDGSLIAGLKIQRGSVYYDFSIEGNLKKLKEALLADDSVENLFEETSAGEQ